MSESEIKHTTTAVDQYQQQLASKLALIRRHLAPFTSANPDVFESPASGYRMRAEFRIWHEGDRSDYVMFPKGKPKEPYRIESFSAGSAAIQRLMPLVIEKIRATPVLRERLFQIDFLTTSRGDCLVSLLYHRKLDEQWASAAEELQGELGISLIGRSRKQKIVLAVDYVDEVFVVAGRTLEYRQQENSFTQPNALINQAMLNWVHRHSSDASGDLLELYCGNGNFSIALSNLFNKVLATELDKAGLRTALHNVESNGIHNIALGRLSAAEVAQALSGVRSFRRLEHVQLDQYDFTTVLVDPPRSGLDAQTLAFIQQFPNIIYVSCNPLSLAENLKQLCETHRVTEFAVFDQFPFTEHVESAVILRA
ncbi:MAG: tRNA (uridine(54)-C5)-methyltransferase TrmA [Pseudomonadales bacterium]